MSDQTTIEWTEATFNPWWGCTKVSPGCDHCYAERDAARFSPTIKLWDEGSTRRTFGAKHWDGPLRWNDRALKAGKRMRVFCASMADVFDKDAPMGARFRLWDLIDRTPNLDWQILTKRVGNVARMIPDRWRDELPAHVWLGISVVNQEEADRDIPKLLALPARVRWLSCEPLLGPIDLRSHLEGLCTLHDFPGGFCVQRDHPEVQRLAWVVAGGESGPKARPMHPDWARKLRDDCAAAGVPFLFKQWGEFAPNARTFAEIETSGRPGVAAPFDPARPWAISPSTSTAIMDRVGKKAAGRTLDGRTYDGYPT